MRSVFASLTRALPSCSSMAALKKEQKRLSVNHSIQIFVPISYAKVFSLCRKK